MSEHHVHAPATEGGLPYPMTLELMNRFQEPEVLAAIADLQEIQSFIAEDDRLAALSNRQPLSRQYRNFLFIRARPVA